jgi:hypothetical protein
VKCSLIDKEQRTSNTIVSFQVLTATSMKITIFCDMAPCSLAGVGQRLRRAYYLNHHGDEHLRNVGQLLRRHIAEDCCHVQETQLTSDTTSSVAHLPEVE